MKVLRIEAWILLLLGIFQAFFLSFQLQAIHVLDKNKDFPHYYVQHLLDAASTCGTLDFS